MHGIATPSPIAGHIIQPSACRANENAFMQAETTRVPIIVGMENRSTAGRVASDATSVAASQARKPASIPDGHSPARPSIAPGKDRDAARQMRQGQAEKGQGGRHDGGGGQVLQAPGRALCGFWCGVCFRLDVDLIALGANCVRF